MTKFSIFSDPTRKLSAVPPELVEYGNSKTTTLLPSAKCTRPLFQDRTGCGGRPSGWHDIVTCQHLVFTSRPAQSAAMPVLFLLSGPKWVFRPAGATRCPNKRSPVPNFTFIGVEMWEYSPQNCQNFEFCQFQKFVPQGRLVCNIFTKFSAFVHGYR